ncbi:ImmA/IrrE family metallo-endopeptidase [Corynebacterium urinipleomorphum]|uniref:ImmA/IrrE family metallo-endopeptidase n=1 Tax=Corynebacterium urinipleomorphum TaxID=1852380 RepID=UPI000B352B9E|nr:hypothetical protein [Corynebacterium urinipleomorphum]
MGQISAASECITVTVDREGVDIPKSVFLHLFEQSFKKYSAPYRDAIDKGRISLSELQKLAHKAEIPWCLFFAPEDLVNEQVRHKAQELRKGVPRRDSISVGTRGSVDVSEVDLIVMDLMRKQAKLREYGGKAPDNKILGLLQKQRALSAEEQAQLLASKLDFSYPQFQQCKDAGTALDYFISRLAAQNVLVSQGVEDQFMPQSTRDIGCSGVTIRDKCYPYIYLTRGRHDDHQEVPRRKIFTLALLTVLIAQKQFSVVEWNDGNPESFEIESEGVLAYDIAAAFLMPRDRLNPRNLETLEGVREAAKHFQVTPSALVVRCARSRLMPWNRATDFLDQLRREFQSAPKSENRGRHKPENAIAKFANHEFVRRMFDALDAGKLSESEFRLVVTHNKLVKRQLLDLRRAVE